MWKDVVGYEGFYKVSDCGEVKSLDRFVKSKNDSFSNKKGQISKQVKNKKRHMRVHLSKEGISRNIEVHRLVAIAFIDNSKNLPCVNHIDENKENNNVKNLEWCDYEYNNKYGNRLIKSAQKHINGKKSKRVYQYSLNGKYLNTYPSCAELKRLYKYDASEISECARGLRKTAYGYLWRYEYSEMRCNYA